MADKELTIISDEKAIAEVKAAIGGDRKAFPTLEAATPILTKVMEVAGKLNVAVEVAGVNDDGTVNESIYDNCAVVIATVGTRVAVAGQNRIAVKAVVMYPQPTLESFLDFDEGKAFLEKILEKEISLVAFRQFRSAASVNEFAAGVQNVPLDAKTYATESGRGSIDTEAFDTLWPGFRSGLKADNPSLYAALPTKEDMYKALRSQSYAEACPNTQAFEERGLIVRIGEILVAAAAQIVDPETGEPAPIDASAIESWIAGRGELDLKWSAPKEKNFDILDSVQL